MSNSNVDGLTEEERQHLHHEEYVAQLLRIRQPSTTESAKPNWQRILDSTGVAAIITVIIGGIFGSIISGIIQSGAKDREFQQLWLKARGDQALAAYGQHLERQQEVVKHVYERIGASISAADDLIALSKPEAAVTEYEGDQKERVRKYRNDLMDKFNQNEASWRSERDSLGLLVNYYHPQQEGISKTWRALKESVSNYLLCADNWHYKHPIERDVSSACQNERSGLDSRLDEFSEKLESNRVYPWEGWESPEKLREKLEKR